MQPTVYLIHRWDATPTNDWYPWLKQELGNKGFTVRVPLMPHTKAPIISEWVDHLASLVEDPGPSTYFIGHSIGCQTIIRYLENLPQTVQVGGTLLIAPWIHLVNLEDPCSEAIAQPWTDTPIYWQKAKTRCHHFTCLFSDTDPWVPLSEASIFKQHLSAYTHILKDLGHFTDKQSPIILEEFLKLL